jgi:predicted solute-binding protein
MNGEPAAHDRPACGPIRNLPLLTTQMPSQTTVLEKPGKMRDESPSFRIGSVPYLNAAPLTYGIESTTEFVPPSELSPRLRAGELDAALLSVTESICYPELILLDGYGICSDGPVLSVFLAHLDPLEEIDTIYLDPASCTSVRLLQVILAELGLNPRLKPLEKPYARAGEMRNVLLIGNPAIAFLDGNPPHSILDLGEAWKSLTGLPFVYAGWIARKDGVVPLQPLHRHLNNVAENGLRHIDSIRENHPDFTPEFRRNYIGGAIHYVIGDAERQGLRLFASKLRQLDGISAPDSEFLVDSIKT